MIKKILHTSDWHIGRKLKNKERSGEFIKFFSWLADVIKNENIEALLVAGDIFDNTTPSVKAQNIYYSFLGKIAKSSCRHVIIISGNHDSPAFLDAPKDLLKLCKIHVIGQACENPEDEVITLYDASQEPELIICAVPYLRDRDVRTFNVGDDVNNIEKSLIDGIKNHYEKVFEHAKKLKENSKIPVIGMGHLFATGGKISEDEGVRSLYVGNSVEINSNIFPDFLTYTALGHLHSPQKISRENIRYSGAPIAMGFGEIKNKKSVYVLELEDEKLMNIKEIQVPVFQRLERIEGGMDEICSALDFLTLQNQSIWLDITYTGGEAQGNLQEKIDTYIKDFQLEVLSIRDESKGPSKINNKEISRNLEDIEPFEMLEILFNQKQVPENQREIFISMYKEILTKTETEILP